MNEFINCEFYYELFDHSLSFQYSTKKYSKPERGSDYGVPENLLMYYFSLKRHIISCIFYIE